jgi:hypothetical protein
MVVREVNNVPPFYGFREATVKPVSREKLLKKEREYAIILVRDSKKDQKKKHAVRYQKTILSWH